MEGIINYLFVLLEQDFEVDIIDVKQNIEENYFNKGWLDSFSFISFISIIEDKYNIAFSNDDFQDRNFATIKGLSEIIERKINFL